MSRAPLQLVTAREERVGVYDMKHFGYYFARSIHCNEPMPRDIDEAWMPGPEFVKTGADYAMAFHKLCVYHLKFDTPLMRRIHGEGKSLEVRSDLLRRYEDGFIRAVVFPQVVKPSYIQVITNDPERPPIDLLTGEKIERWQETHHEYGGWHSHNVLGVTPSRTDDATEEKTPGHYAIFGAYRRKSEDAPWDFTINATVVMPNGETANKRRTRLAYQDKDGRMQTRALEWSDTMEWDAENDATFHPDVLQNIMLEVPKSDKWEQEKPQGVILGPDGRPWWEQFNDGSWESGKGRVHIVGRLSDDKKKLRETMDDFIYTEFNRGWTWRNRKGVQCKAQSSPAAGQLAWTTRSIVEDLLELQNDEDGETLVEEILAPLLSDHTKYRLVSESRMEELETMEEWHAENA